jgi:hypothetical protein
MRALAHLPDGYHPAGILDIRADRRLLLALNAAGLLVTVLSGWLFLWLLLTIRPGAAPAISGDINMASAAEVLLAIAAVILLSAVNIVLHEGVHGFFFWRYTGDRPEFAFRIAYAYAAAPGWYLPRGAFFVTTLAPLVVISLGGLLLSLVLPPGALAAIWLVMVLNASGAVGDLLVAVWMLFQPAGSLFQDRGDAVTVFHPAHHRKDQS